jgi:hypothetical protein
MKPGAHAEHASESNDSEKVPISHAAHLPVEEGSLMVPAGQTQPCTESVPGKLTLPAEHTVHVVAVLVSVLYVPAGQLTQESPERIRPAPHSLVQPALKEPDHPASHTHAALGRLPVIPAVLVCTGHVVQLASLPAEVLYVSTGQTLHNCPVP